MSEQPYTPDEEAASVAWIEFEASADDINEADAEFGRFIEAVKRDAAREALNGLAERFDRMGDGADQSDRWAWEWHAQDEVVDYRDTHYPEGESNG